MNKSKLTPPKRRFHSDFLFPKTSFLVGLGSVLNIFPVHLSNLDFQAGAANDWKALRNDFGVIGDDFQQVFFELEIEKGNKEK